MILLHAPLMYRLYRTWSFWFLCQYFRDGLHLDALFRHAKLDVDAGCTFAVLVNFQATMSCHEENQGLSWLMDTSVAQDGLRPKKTVQSLRFQHCSSDCSSCCSRKFRLIPTHLNDRRAPAMPSEVLVFSTVEVIVGMLSTNVIIPEFLKMSVDAYSWCLGW